MTSQAQTAPAARTFTARLRLGRGLKAEQPASDEGAHADSSQHRRGRIPRIARLMALAIKLDAMLQRGEVSTQRELAAVARVTPARLTQILNLLHLAPDIQEQLLCLPPVVSGRDPISERELRTAVGVCSWSHQRAVLSHACFRKEF